MTIYQIAVPIFRTVTLEQQLLENHNHPDISSKDHPNNVLAEMNADALLELAERLHDGYAILDKYDTTNRQTTYRAYVLYKPDNAPKPASGNLAMAHFITRLQTCSKSTEQHFDYWKLELTNGRTVNIFDHPDSERNTFKIAILEGWEIPFKRLDYNSTHGLEVNIACVVSDDGNWLKLEQIMPYSDYPDTELFSDNFQDYDPVDYIDNIPFE